MVREAFPIRPSMALLDELKQIRDEYAAKYGKVCSWQQASDIFLERSKHGGDGKWRILP